MRYIIGFMFLLLCFSGYGQTVRTVGLVYVASAPTHTPSSQGAWLAVDTTSGSWYEWERTTGVWRDAGYRVQFTYTSGAPNYTPSKARGRVAVNSGDSLYVYQNATWNLLSGGGGGADNWGTDVVNRDGTLSGDGTVGSPLKVDTSVIATIYDINSLSSTDTSGYNLAFTRSSDTLYLRDGNGTLSVVLPAGSVDTDDQGLTIGVSGPTYSIDIDGGSDVTISAGGIITLSESTANVLTFTANETDGSTSNEIQNVDSLFLSGTTLGISLSADGVAQKTVDLSSLQDGTGTDDQKVDTFAIVSNVLRLSVESDAEAFKSVDLSPYLDNTDTQDLTIDSVGDWYTVTLVNGGSVNVKKDTDTQLTEEQVDDFVGGMVTGNTETLISVTYQDGDGTIDFVVEDDLSLYDNTTSGFISAEVDGSVTNEIQVVDTLVLSGTTLGISLSSDGVPQKTVDLASLQDGIGTDDQKIDTFEIVSNVLRLSAESDAEPFKSVDLSPYLDDTDTDDQGLTVTGSGPDYVINQEDGTDITVSAAGIVTLSEPSANELRITATEVDGSTSNELQDLTIGGSGPTYTIDIASGADVTIAAAGINTLSEGTANVLTITGTEVDGSITNEIQQIDTFDISSNTLRASLSSDGVPFKSVDLSPYLDNTDAQTFSGSDDGTTFTLDLSGASTDISFKEGTNVTITRTGTELTFASSGSADNWGTDVVNRDGTLSGNGTVGTPLKADTTVIATVYDVSQVDQSATNEIQQITPSDNGTNFWWALGSSTDSIVLVEGSNITMTRSGDNVTIAASGGGSTDLTVGGSGPTYIIESSTGNDVTVEAAGGIVLSEGTANILTFTGTPDGINPNSTEDIKNAGFTAVVGKIHPVDCSGGAITVTPPSSPTINQRFGISDAEAVSGTNNITINFSGSSQKLYATVQNYILNVNGGYVEFIYMGTTTGWIATKG